MSTAHRDALASAGLLVDEVLSGISGYEPFAGILHAAASAGTMLVARSTLDAWTAHAKSALPRLREDVATWVMRLINHVNVLYELAMAAEALQTTPARLHQEYLRAFVGYLTPQYAAGSRPKMCVSLTDPLETLAAQALGIRDAVAVERGTDGDCECAVLLPRDMLELMVALGREDEVMEKGGDKTPPTVN